jgi:hypothetical protein
MSAPVIWPNGGTAFPVYWRDQPRAPFRWTSAFGMRTHPVTGAPSTFHYGLDLVGWSDILAPATGTVTFAGYNGGAGNEVRIRADGPNAFVKGTVFRLLHNRSLNVRTGQRVTQGQKVAVMGTTGSSTGVHSHLETRPNGGAAIDPISYYRRALAGWSSGGSTTPTPPTEAFIMATEVLVTEKNNNGKALADKDRRAAFVNTESGFACDLSWMTLADADKWARQVGMPAGAIRLSDSAFDKYLGRLAAV